MAVITVRFTHDMGVNVTDLLSQDGLAPKAARRLRRRHMLAEARAHRGLGRAYFAYYRPGFHPRDHDDGALLDQVLASDEGLRGPYASPG